MINGNNVNADLYDDLLDDKISNMQKCLESMRLAKRFIVYTKEFYESLI